jgi:site-specific DNA-methyltransferase (adenine-specific)
MKMATQHAKRNKTIELNNSDISRYANLCVHSFADNSIIHGDTFEILNGLPSNFVDLLIVDPPYNLSKIYGLNSFKKMNFDKYASFTRKWINAVKHTLTLKASVYVCCDWQTSLIVGQILGEFFTVQNRITWQREKGRGALQNWKNAMEDIWFATVSSKEFTFNVDDVKMRRRVIAPYKIGGKPKDWNESEDGNFRDTFPSNFWDDISIPYWSMPENTDHPTQKPEKLIAKLILASSIPGDIVLDPFLGSGTTAVVAKKLGRRFMGIERERKYCALAQKRLEMADNNPEIQGYSDGVFWERNTLAFQKKCKNREQQALLSFA